MGSMRLINIDAFLRREWLFHSGRQVERRTKILEFRDDEATEYAILSHRSIDPTEVDYEEMIDLAKMDRQERDEIRGRLGYKKIVNTCKQAKQHGYEWVWIDTCCIDKRSSAELSEAINSMYRWYRNSQVCYAYLHDFGGPSFPDMWDDPGCPTSNGWPEWFSRGWTLQEMIAPRNLQFFNKDWRPIGDKKRVARKLKRITEVPEHILADGLEGNRPCVAQIISWAANRTTTRVEDRAYSLMGLLDVNMPMLYGEGKKAFHRLQLEIIRSSNDQSIFAWENFPSSSVRIGSILADDPSFFEDCSDMRLMDQDEFTKKFSQLSSTDADSLGVFPITNRGIQIRMPFRRYPNCNSVFKAYLSCCGRVGLVSIDLVLWNSNYYRYPSTSPWCVALEDSPAEFRQVYLQYQDTPNHAVTFEIIVDPRVPIKDTFTLTNADPFCVKAYPEDEHFTRPEIVFGQCLGLDWVHLNGIFPTKNLETLICRGPDWALSLADKPSENSSHGRLWICHLHLPNSTVIRIYRAAWERSKVRLRIEASQDCFLIYDEWKTYDIEKVGDPIQDPRGLVLHDAPSKCEKSLEVDGFLVKFSLASERTKLGDYGYFTDSGQFFSQGNLFSDFKFLISEADITPGQKKVTGFDVSDATGSTLPNNPAFNSLLASHAPRLTNSYLVTRIVRRPGESRA